VRFPRPASSSPPRPSILLIENDHGLRLALRSRLEGEGYRVALTSDGDDGLARSDLHAFDLVVLAARLPRRSGLDVCRDLRRRGFRTPVLMLTERRRTRDGIEGLRRGADDYLAKPFAMAELLARIEARLRRVPIRLGHELYRFAAVEVDLRSAEVRRHGVPVGLSPKEFRLLRHLIGRPGVTIGRDELLDAVWGRDAMPTPRTVDVHVAWLRQKLEPNPKRPRFILTVHGRGYRFAEEGMATAEADGEGAAGPTFPP
jgi:two-component system, OmpR family, alkaline phosphatase synthesis response regulator PhoP